MQAWTRPHFRKRVSCITTTHEEYKQIKELHFQKVEINKAIKFDSFWQGGRRYKVSFMQGPVNGSTWGIKWTPQWREEYMDGGCGLNTNRVLLKSCAKTYMLHYTEYNYKESYKLLLY